jgi:GDP-L-fucose synthase
MGEWDNFEDGSAHVIPMLIKRFLKAKEENLPETEVWGSGNATREFMYAGDAAKAIVKAVELYDKPEPINLGTGREISIIDLAETIADIAGYKGKIVLNKSMPDGQPRRVLDITRMQAELNFGDESVSLEDGLRKTIKWYKNNRGQNR